MADIKKMFHQVTVQEKDRDPLRFLWRSNKGEKFQDLRLNVQLFGKVHWPLVFFILHIDTPCSMDHQNKNQLDKGKKGDHPQEKALVSSLL